MVKHRRINGKPTSFNTATVLKAVDPVFNKAQVLSQHIGTYYRQESMHQVSRKLTE